MSTQAKVIKEGAHIKVAAKTQGEESKIVNEKQPLPQDTQSQDNQPTQKNDSQIREANPENVASTVKSGESGNTPTPNITASDANPASGNEAQHTSPDSSVITLVSGSNVELAYNTVSNDVGHLDTSHGVFNLAANSAPNYLTLSLNTATPMLSPPTLTVLASNNVLAASGPYGADAFSLTQFKSFQSYDKVGVISPQYYSQFQTQLGGGNGGSGVVEGEGFGNFVVKAASVLTGIFQTEEKTKAVTVSPFTNFKIADNSGFFTKAVVTSIPHQLKTDHNITVIGDRIAVENGKNHLFFIDPTALATSTNALSNMNLTAGALVGDITYMMRKAGTGLTTISITQTVPGAVIFSPTSAQLLNAGTGFYDLTFSQNNIYNITNSRHGYAFASTSVPNSIAATTTGPANAVLIYDFYPGLVPSAGSLSSLLFPISDYSPNSQITSIHNTIGISQYKLGVVIDASNNLTMIVNSLTPDQAAAKAVYSVDATTLALTGKGQFSNIANPGLVIDKGSQYTYVDVIDTNRDGNSDMLFGSENNDNALLLYGAVGMPTLIKLYNLSPTIDATKFVMPANNIVGEPLAAGATPLDGGAALNAVSTKTAGVSFLGDVNGDGFMDLLVQKHATDYSYDSDLAYIVYGQANYFPDRVELNPYGNADLKTGIVGKGYEGNTFIQNIKGFTITGPVAETDGTVAPSNFAIKGIGDINGDGFDDVLAFANNNAAYAIFGHPTIGNVTSNINLGVITPYMLPLFYLNNVAGSTEVPSIHNFTSGNVNGDGLADIIFSSSINVNALTSQTIPFSNYLISLNSSTGADYYGGILSGAVFADSYFKSANNVSGVIGAPVGSAYIIKNTDGTFDTSHIILGLDNRSTLQGFSGIDNFIGGTGNQYYVQQGAGAVNSKLPGIVGSTFIGGNGTNIFEVQDPAFHMIKGGNNFDTLRLNSGVLDFSKVPDPTASSLIAQASHIVTSIEKIELGNQAGLVITPESLLEISGIISQGSTTVLGSTDSGTTLRGTLLVVGKNGAAQDPHLAPTLDLYNDAYHQWTLVGGGPASGTINGVGYSQYTLNTTTAAGGSSAQQAALMVTSNVQVQVHTE